MCKWDAQCNLLYIRALWHPDDHRQGGRGHGDCQLYSEGPFRHKRRDCAKLKSNLISKTQTAILLKAISEQWSIQLPKIKNLKVYQISGNAQIITGEKLKIVKIDEQYVPLLSEVEVLEKFPKVTVDMGAVKFMCKGANLMRPGIVRFAEFQKDGLVCIAEESHSKFLAVGKAMVDSSELDEMEKGEVVKNIHYVSDVFWETGKTIYN